MAIKLNHIISISELSYYYFMKKEYELMEYYLNIGLKLYSDDCMFIYGLYYYLIKEYDLMLYYFNMAIEYGNKSAYHYLGIYYQEIYKNIPLMLSAYEKTNTISSYHNLSLFYFKLNDMNMVIEYCKKCINILQYDDKNYINVISSYYLLFLVYMKQNNERKSYYYALTLLNTRYHINKYTVPNPEVTYMLNIGNYFYRNKIYKYAYLSWMYNADTINKLNDKQQNELNAFIAQNRNKTIKIISNNTIVQNYITYFLYHPTNGIRMKQLITNFYEYKY